MKKFSMVHHFFPKEEPVIFSDKNPPRWLKGDGKGSTMDNRWFWDDHVMTLEVGQSVETDFNTITRIE